MRKIVFFAHADTVGTDTAELVVFENGISDKEADEYCQDLGYEWTSQWEPSYGGEDDQYEDPDQYYEACGWWWEDYCPAEHNGKLCGTPEGYEEGPEGY